MINNEHQALKNRRKDIIDRQDAVAYKHGGESAKPSDIIGLNVCGTELFARRDTLTVVKGSRLEALFSGRWENQLLRDESGRVFMRNVDPDVFKKILEYLYMVKISKDGPPLPKVVATKKEAFEMYMDFFKLQGINGNVSSEGALTEATLSSAMDEKEMLAMMTKMKQELDTIEHKLEKEESFVAFFTKGSCIADSPNDMKFDDSSCFSYKSDDLSSTESKKSAKYNGIIHVYLNGEIMALCADTISLLVFVTCLIKPGSEIIRL